MSAAFPQHSDAHESPRDVNEDDKHDSNSDTTLLLQKLLTELQGLNSNLKLLNGSNGPGQQPQAPGSQETPVQQQQDARENLVNSESRPDPPSQPCPRGELAQGFLPMLESFPSQDLLASILQHLKNAIDPCKCDIGPEPVGVYSMWHYSQKTQSVHWSFRNAILVVPASPGSSQLLKLSLHSPTHTPTPAEKQACQRFIQSQWPREIVQANWTSYHGPYLGSEKCIFWGFSGLSLPRINIYQFYVPSSGQDFQLRMPRMSYRRHGTGSTEYLWTDVGGHPTMAQPRDPGDVNTGQIWYVHTV